MSARALASEARAVRQETQSDTIQRCVNRAASRAARRIPHLDVDCLGAILRAHIDTRLDRFRGEAPLEHWVNSVLRNKVADLVKFEMASQKVDTSSIEGMDQHLADPSAGPVREAAEVELVRRLEEDYSQTREGRILLMILTGEASSITQAAQLVQWNHPTALARVREHPLVRELLSERQTA